MKHLAIAFLAISLFAGCGNSIEGVGNPIDERRTVEDYDVIYLNSSFDVTVRQALLSDQNKVVVNAQENLLPFISTRVEGSRLIVESTEKISPSTPVRIEIITNGVTKIVNEGSGSIKTANTLKADRMKIQGDGSGDMTIKVKAPLVKVENDGSGDIRLLGETQELEILLDGSGEVNTLETRASQVEVSNDGSGNVSVSVSDVLGIELSGSGSVKYAGNPQEIEQSVNGSGSVQRLN